MILNMQKIYTQYLNKANKADKERNEIYTYVLGLKQELHISNEEIKQAVFFLQQQTIKVKYDERMIDTLQSSVLLKPNISLPSIEKFINQHDSVFTYVLSLLVNRQLPSKNQWLIRNIHIKSNNGSLRSGKLTKTLPDPPIFTNKNIYISVII